MYTFYTNLWIKINLSLTEKSRRKKFNGKYRMLISKKKKLNILTIK